MKDLRDLKYSHPTPNSTVFLVPVDDVTLGLLDYRRIVKKRMDLGTVRELSARIVFSLQLT